MASERPETRSTSSMASISTTESVNSAHVATRSSENEKAAEAEKRSHGDDSQSTTRPRVSRQQSQASLGLQRLMTGGSMAHTFTHPLENEKTTASVIVDFDGEEDPYRPMNWSTGRKVKTIMLYGLLTASSTWASSSYSAAIEEIGPYFGVSSTVATLGISLFLVGFGVGPLLWAPLSEVYGRRVSIVIPMFIAVCFSFASATAKDLQTLMITRFFTGFFGAAPVANTGGVVSDLFTPNWRGFAVAGYSLAVVDGALLAPIVSAAIASSYLGWRWTEYITGILQMFILALVILFAEESYAPNLLETKARRLRFSTGNWALHCKHEEWDVSFANLAKKYLVRPVQLLRTPICAFIAIYASFVYGILYSTLGSIPLMFGKIRGWGPVAAELPFIALLLGSFFGLAINIYNQYEYNKAFRAAGNRPVPERRLPPMMFGGIVFAGANFMIGWTSSPHIHWIVPCIGIALFGMGFFCVFQAALLYLLDTFQMFAASAVASNTFLRSVVAAALPLVITQMYENLGVGPGESVFAGIACLLMPVPWIFFFYGERIRARHPLSAVSVLNKELLKKTEA